MLLYLNIIGKEYERYYSRRWRRHKTLPVNNGDIEAVTSGVANREDDLNDTIQKFSIGWDVSRISRLTRCIMQLAIYEILYVEDVPTGVAVSEAVRIAKKYDGDDTGSFVNGILGSFARSLNAEEVK